MDSSARREARLLQREYRLSLGEGVVRRSVSLASSFLLNERHPAKALKIRLSTCAGRGLRFPQRRRRKLERFAGSAPSGPLLDRHQPS